MFVRASESQDIFIKSYRTYKTLKQNCVSPANSEPSLHTIVRHPKPFILGIIVALTLDSRGGHGMSKHPITTIRHFKSSLKIHQNEHFSISLASDKKTLLLCAIGFLKTIFFHNIIDGYSINNKHFKLPTHNNNM